MEIQELRYVLSMLKECREHYICLINELLHLEENNLSDEAFLQDLDTAENLLEVEIEKVKNKI